VHDCDEAEQECQELGKCWTVQNETVLNKEEQEQQDNKNVLSIHF
jgi:hypothetical protein